MTTRQPWGRGRLAPLPALLLFAAVAALCVSGVGRAGEATAGDASPASLTGKPGDATRGRAIVLDRRVGNCLICHKAPVEGEPFQGDLGPDLAGVSARLNEGQIRYRLIDQSRLNPATLMPPYHRTEGLTRVAERYQGRPVLTAGEIEDVVAWLATLK